MRIRKLTFIAVFLCLSQFSLFSQSDILTRGLWIVRNEITSPEKIDEILEIANKYEFTDLFVQVRGRGDAYYSSAYEPKAEGLEDGFDPLGYLIKRKGNNGFRIHAWINVFYLWSNDSLPKSEKHLVHQQPDWIVYPANAAQDSSLLKRRGDSEGLYNSPLLPEVQKHILKIVDDIISNYKVDGIHLDYIRYPGKDFDFHPWVRHQFRKSYILDPLEFKNDTKSFVRKYSNVGFELYYNRWTNFLRDGLSNFVKELSQRIHSEDEQAIISAAVKADLAQAHLYFYQEWDRWLREGWIDYAVPMNYTTNNVEFLNRIRSMLNSGLMNKLLIGISLYNQSENAAIEKIRAVNELDLKGFVLFSYKQFEGNSNLQEMYFQEVLNKQE